MGRPKRADPDTPLPFGKPEAQFAEEMAVYRAGVNDALLTSEPSGQTSGGPSRAGQAGQAKQGREAADGWAADRLGGLVAATNRRD